MQIIETMPQTQMVEEFVDKLGSFYEIVDDSAPPPASKALDAGLKVKVSRTNGNGVQRVVAGAGGGDSPSSSDSSESDSPPSSPLPASHSSSASGTCILPGFHLFFTNFLTMTTVYIVYEIALLCIVDSRPPINGRHHHATVNGGGEVRVNGGLPKPVNGGRHVASSLPPASVSRDVAAPVAAASNGDASVTSDAVLLPSLETEAHANGGDHDHDDDDGDDSVSTLSGSDLEFCDTLDVPDVVMSVSESILKIINAE